LGRQRAFCGKPSFRKRQSSPSIYNKGIYPLSECPPSAKEDTKIKFVLLSIALTCSPWPFSRSFVRSNIRFKLCTIIVQKKRSFTLIKITTIILGTPFYSSSLSKFSYTSRLSSTYLFKLAKLILHLLHLPSTQSNKQSSHYYC